MQGGGLSTAVLVVKVERLGWRVSGSGFRVEGGGFRVEGFGLRVKGEGAARVGGGRGPGRTVSDGVFPTGAPRS